MTTLPQPQTKTSNYVFETRAIWKVPVIYLSIPGAAYLDGNLGLTNSGRLEFVLQNGKVVFSAAISQAQVRLHTLSTMTVRHGAYRYIFLYNRLDTHSPHESSTETAGEQWERQLAQHQTIPADNLPVINTDVPSAALATLQFLVMTAATVTAAIYGALFLSHNPVLPLPANDIVAGALFVIAGAFLLIWLIRRIHSVERRLLSDGGPAKQ